MFQESCILKLQGSKLSILCKCISAGSRNADLV